MIKTFIINNYKLLGDHAFVYMDGCEVESYPSEEQVKERFPQCVGLIVEWRTIVNERIEKFFEYRKMPIEERINKMKGVYGDIIPENEMTHKPFTYVRMYG